MEHDELFGLQIDHRVCVSLAISKLNEQGLFFTSLQVLHNCTDLSLGELLAGYVLDQCDR